MSKIRYNDWWHAQFQVKLMLNKDTNRYIIHDRIKVQTGILYTGTIFDSTKIR
jgi:hypothetical protein